MKFFSRITAWAFIGIGAICVPVYFVLSFALILPGESGFPLLLQWPIYLFTGKYNDDYRESVEREKERRGMNLRGKYLNDVDLSAADLSRSDLSSGTFMFANFYKSDLSGANLSRANLAFAFFWDANLSEADFSNANLRGAKFDRADFSGANLHGANIAGSILKTAKGLTQVQLGEACLREEYGAWKPPQLPAGLSPPTKKCPLHWSQSRRSKSQ